MAMKKGSDVTLMMAICLMVAVAMVVPPTEAVTCTATELSSCAGVLLSPGPQQPSQECCSKLKEQQPCLCGYLRDPSLSPYVSSVNIGTISATCGVPIPTC